MDTREHPVSSDPVAAPPAGADGALSETPRSMDFRVLPEIDNTNRNFKGQQRNEIILCFCRKHVVVLLPVFFGLLLVSALTAAPVIFGSQVGLVNGFLGSVLVVALTYALHYFFLRVFNYYLQTVIVTNFRIVELNQTLFFSQVRNSIDLREIQDIAISQKGIIKTLLNYGELKITLSSAHATRLFQHMPNPEYHFRKINKSKRQYISMRRMEKP